MTFPLIGVKAGLEEALAPGRLLVPTAVQDGGARKGRVKHLLGHGLLSLCQHLLHRGTQKAISRKIVLMLLYAGAFR